MGYATGMMVRYPYLPCSSVLGVLSSLVHGVPCTECCSGLGWEKGCVTAERQSRRNGRNGMLLTLAIRLTESHVSKTSKTVPGMGPRLEVSI